MWLMLNIQKLARFESLEGGRQGTTRNGGIAHFRRRITDLSLLLCAVR